MITSVVCRPANVINYMIFELNKSHFNWKLKKVKPKRNYGPENYTDKRHYKAVKYRERIFVKALSRFQT
jgi:hypothetical protein